MTPDTLFELRDTIVSARHSYVEGSAEINGQQLAACTRREDIPMQAEAYVLVETGEDGNQVLSFGGTKFSPGRATNGNPAESFKITYKTQINEELLLPGEVFDALEPPDYKSFLPAFARWRRENPNPDRSLWYRYPEDLDIFNQIYTAPPARLVLFQPLLDNSNVKPRERQHWMAHGVKWVDNYVDELWNMGIGRE